MLENFSLLYVEDNKTTVAYLKAMLEPLVKELLIAYDGNEGVRLYKEKKPDIILTDVNMPNKDGIEMATEIKQIDSSQIIIILTEFEEMELLHRSVEIGIDGYILKPIQGLEQLLKPLNKSAKRLQEQLDKKELENILITQGKTSAVGEMVSNIAHQWRQPLSTINASLLKLRVQIEIGKALDNETILNTLETVEQQTVYLSETIDDFRDFLKMDKSTKKLINVKDVMQKISEIESDTFKQHHIEYQASLEDIDFFGNQNQLIQILINIINNAKDAILRTNFEDKVILTNISKDDDCITIQIQDSGGGIPEDILSRIFEPYFTTKHKAVGTGLGLYLSFKAIKNFFAGEIIVKNNEFTYKNRKLTGALFTIKIPLTTTPYDLNMYYI